MILLALLLAAPSVADAERGFAAQAARDGQWAAFRAYAAPDAILYTPRKTLAAPALAHGAETAARLDWRPQRTLTSCDGTLAFSTGPWARSDGKTGVFDTIWRRDASGWRWIYDGGHDGDAAPTGPLEQDQAACPGPLGSVGAIAEALPDTPIRIAALTGGALANLVAASDGAMPVALRLGGVDAEGMSADRTLRWRINAVLGAKAGAHLLRVWSWDGRRYRLAVLDVTGTGA